MFVQTIKCSLLIIFFIIQLINHFKVLANDGPKTPTPIASINVSTVSGGSQFIMECRMPTNYTIKNESFFMHFCNTIEGTIFYYEIFEPSSSGFRIRNGYDITDRINRYFLLIRSVKSTVATNTTFAIIMTTRKVAFWAQYYCFAEYSHEDSSENSTFLPITVNYSFSYPTISNNVKQVQLNHPFTLTCSLSKDFITTEKYQVAFYNSLNGLLATYEIDVHGDVTLASNEYNGVSAHLGARAAFPIFDLEIREQTNRKLSYSCELITVNVTTRKNISYRSNSWSSQEPFVDFEANYIGTEHRGKCLIDNFSGFGKEYQVLFYSDLGAQDKEKTLLGYFWFRPQKPIEFVSEKVFNWKSIVHGYINNPEFEIVGTVEPGLHVNGKKWWCALNFTESGHSAKEIMSNFQTL